MFKKFKEIEIEQKFFWRGKEFTKTEKYPVCGTKYSNAYSDGLSIYFKDDDEVEFYIEKLPNIGKLIFLDNYYLKGYTYIRFVDELEWLIKNIRDFYIIEWLEPSDLLKKEIEDFYAKWFG